MSCVYQKTNVESMKTNCPYKRLYSMNTICASCDQRFGNHSVENHCPNTEAVMLYTGNQFKDVGRFKPEDSKKTRT